VHTIPIQPWAAELERSVTDYPDFLLHLLLREGVGRIEDQPGESYHTPVRWRFTSRLTGATKVLTSLSTRLFRPVLARFAVKVGLSPYGGHDLFTVTVAGEGGPRPERFALFLCNEPTMGIWVKLYLYCIDGVWPMPGAGPRSAGPPEHRG
jgi:hypothetical protein